MQNNNESKLIKILLVDDHALLRKGISLLLQEESEIVVVGEASNGEEALLQVKALKPDIVVMDISMPKLNGIEATKQIVATSPESKVIALSIHSAKHYVEGMLDAGAAGYLLKESLPEELIQAIFVVMAEQMYLSSAVTDIVVSGFRNRCKEPSKAELVPDGKTNSAPAAISANVDDINQEHQLTKRLVIKQTSTDLLNSLTNREFTILKLLTQRLQSKEIARKLFVSTETVKSHLKNIYQKLNVNNRREAAIKANEMFSKSDLDKLCD
ncbi:response regulator transcription factor [Moritella sp. Urea-trap-13]|uniref:response regulator n=1 Tax=Moritella sp. Urea-trap-13 TaxID=2058327 RepID=UPI000C33571E|nr:response regulator transcription factor [Moritella sp. Urea-trap-13]PKH07841.1 hypothetical protein CXF93_03875 [Moritella sp. Urea-trap-13]